MKNVDATWMGRHWKYLLCCCISSLRKCMTDKHKHGCASKHSPCIAGLDRQPDYPPKHPIEGFFPLSCLRCRSEHLQAPTSRCLRLHAPYRGGCGSPVASGKGGAPDMPASVRNSSKRTLQNPENSPKFFPIRPPYVPRPPR